MGKTEDERILELVNPEYLKKIPSFVRPHAVGNTCRLIEKEFPEIYAEFGREQVSAEARERMTDIVNDIFEERMKKHHML